MNKTAIKLSIVTGNDYEEICEILENVYRCYGETNNDTRTKL